HWRRLYQISGGPGKAEGGTHRREYAHRAAAAARGMASEQLIWNPAPLWQGMAVAVCPGVCARSKGWQILGGLEPSQGDVMLFWAPCGRGWMATDEQRACTHLEGAGREPRPSRPRNRVASQRRTPRQVLVLASSCVKWCRSIEIGSWLRGRGLGQYEATFRNDEIDHASCPPRLPRTCRNSGGPLSCEFGGPLAMSS